MAKIDLEKLICSLAKRKYFSEEKLQGALKEQGLEYKDGEIVESQKPKFKVGDWVVYNCDICQIVKREEGCNKLVTNFGIEKELVNERNLSTARLWTIQDAKDGDVLACGDKATDCPFIFHNLTEKLNPRSYCGVNTLCGFQENDENGGSWCDSEEARPATKEQRDILFQKMEEAGYKWDAEKKELKKIRKPLYGRGDIIEYRGCPYFIEEVVTPKENIFYYNVVSLCFGEKLRRISIGAEGEKDIILISNNRFDYENANIQQKDFAPKASTANRQLYNRAILTILSNYVEKYPDIRFGQMLFNLDIKPHFDEESKEIYLKLDKTINKRK